MKRFSILLAAAALLVAVGSFASPAAKKPATAATHNHEHQEGSNGTWKGEVLDAGCYLGHGAMGEKHKECALKCASNGMPLMLMVSGKPILLTPDHENPDPYNDIKGWAGSVVEVSGTLSTRGGVSGINVTGSKLAAAAK